MNDPIDFNNDSMPFSKVQNLSQMSTASNSLAFCEIEPRFMPFDLDPMNFNTFEGTLESRLNHEINSHQKNSKKNNNQNSYFDQEMTIPTSPIPTSPIPTYSYTNFNNVSNQSYISINQPPTFNNELDLKNSFQDISPPNVQEASPRRKPLVLLPFQSIYDVELSVQKMKEYESSRFD